MSEQRKLSTADLARQDAADSESAPSAGAGPAAETGSTVEPLFSEEAAGGYREEWTSIQGAFVDEPREAVERADSLVADLMQRLASQFARTREGLETQWDGDEDVSTEDLRLALQQYRSFFQRLLNA